MKILFILTSIIFLTSCQDYDLEKCTDLYVRAYRGHPRSASEYEKECKSRDLIPQFNCQTALEKLILGQNEAGLKKEFGEHVMKCFTKRDLAKFLK